MYNYSDKPRNGLINLVKFVALLLSTILLSTLLGFYLGYAEFQTPQWMVEPTATPTATPPPEYDLKQAEAFFAQGDLQGAVRSYDQALRKEPTNDQALIKQARLLIYTRNTGKALERAAQAMTINPNSPDNLAYYCRALDWEAKYEEAFAACFCSTELHPKNADGYAFLSEIYTDLGNVRNGKSYAQQAIDLNYNNVNAHFNMGYALEVQGKYDEAAAAYDRAITLAPNVSNSYIAAGLMYHTMGGYRKYQSMKPYEVAADRFKRAIRLQPFNPEPYTRLGWTYYYDEQYGRAVDALEQGLGVDPTYAKGWGNLGTIYYARRRFEEATTAFPKAIELSENEFLRRARLLEVYTEAPAASGPVQVPILRGRFEWPDKPMEMKYTAELKVLSYTPSTDLNLEQNCAEQIAQSLRAETIIMPPDQPITFTAAFSHTTGQAVLDLNTGNLSITMTNLPQSAKKYELKIFYWPSRTDSLGVFSPTPDNQVYINVKFDEKLDAPVEYYYQLGLSYAYIERCKESEPWLLKSLELEPAAWNPAWQGLERCPSPKSPPTPIPTETPYPTATPTK